MITIERKGAVALITVKRAEPADPERQALLDRIAALEAALAKLDALFTPPRPPGPQMR